MLLQTYPVIRYLFFLVLGILFSKLTEFDTYTYLGVAAFMALLGGILIKNRVARHLLPLSFFFLGIFSSKLYNQKIQKDHFSHFQNVENILVEINSYTETKSKTYKVTGKVLAVNQNNIWKIASGNVLLYFNQNAGIFPKYGEIYQLKNNLREIEAPKNPYEFNYQQYQARRNIFYHQFLRQGDFQKIGVTTQRTIYYYANLANVYTHEVFRNVLDNASQWGVAEAMIGGMRSELDMETLQWYTHTGTVHVLAVSGMHVAILFWVLNAFFSLFLDQRKLPFLVSVLLFLWAYAVFTGLSPSVSRSTFMFTVFQLGLYLGRTGSSVNTLLFSALILLLIVPTWLFDVGFQLSYLAVLGIILLQSPIAKLLIIKNTVLRWLWEITATSLAAQIYTLPLILYYFHQFPNYILLANPIVCAICILLLPLGLLLLILYKIPLVGVVLGYIFKALIVIMNFCVEKIHNLPMAITDGFHLTILEVALLFSVIGLMQYFIKTHRTIYFKGAILLLLIYLSNAAFTHYKQNKQAEITFHYIPKSYGISIIKGHSALFLSTDSLVKEPLIRKYHLKSYYDARGITQSSTMIISDSLNELLTTELGKIFCIKESNTKQIPKDTDYLLVSNNALSPEFSNSTIPIILDGTNRADYATKIQKSSENIINLYQNGSKIYPLNEKNL